jgi:hypothetical protein
MSPHRALGRAGRQTNGHDRAPHCEGVRNCQRRRHEAVAPRVWTGFLRAVWAVALRHAKPTGPAPASSRDSRTYANDIDPAFDDALRRNHPRRSMTSPRGRRSGVPTRELVGAASVARVTDRTTCCRVGYSRLPTMEAR